MVHSKTLWQNNKQTSSEKEHVKLIIFFVRLLPKSCRLGAFKDNNTFEIWVSSVAKHFIDKLMKS